SDGVEPSGAPRVAGASALRRLIRYATNITDFPRSLERIAHATKAGNSGLPPLTSDGTVAIWLIASGESQRQSGGVRPSAPLVVARRRRECRERLHPATMEERSRGPAV